MASSKSRLGRGLGGLISGAGGSKGAPSAGDEDAPDASGTGPKSPKGGTAPAKAGAKTAASASGGTGTGRAESAPAGGVRDYREIAVGTIKANPYQPRREIDPQQIAELARSIEAEGLLQPIVVRSKGRAFELIAGERRLRAFEHLKRRAIPARVIEASDASSAALALIENLQRENLNPIDEATGYASLLRDFDLTQEKAAERVGKGRATVANALRLLSLDAEIQGFLSRRLLSTGHAKVLLGLESSEQRKLLARRIIETGMSVREAERQLKRLKSGTAYGASATGAKRNGSEAEQTALRDLEKRIGEHFNTRVSLKHSPKKGKLTIEYFGNEDLERILEKIGLPG